jgi:hypothetical protein
MKIKIIILKRVLNIKKIIQEKENMKRNIKITIKNSYNYC